MGHPRATKGQKAGVLRHAVGPLRPARTVPVVNGRTSFRYGAMPSEDDVSHC